MKVTLKLTPKKPGNLHPQELDISLSFDKSLDTSKQSRQSQSFCEGGDGKRRVFGTKMAELPKDIDPYGVLGLLYL